MSIQDEYDKEIEGEPSPESSEIFLICEGDCHGLMVQHEDSDDSFYVTMWQPTYFNHPYYWKTRLRMIWKLLRGKRLDGDGIILSKENSQKIVEFITVKTKKK